MRSETIHFSKAARSGGFALILALIFTALVAVGVVAFLTNSLADRKEAQALGNAERAAQIAQSAADIGIAKLQALLRRYPDSATCWSYSPQPATVLHYRPHPDGAGTIDPSTALRLLPLYSGARQSTTGDSFVLAHPAHPYEHPDNSVDLNQARHPGDPHGWIGSPGGSRMEVRVPWVEMEEAGTEGKRIIRFAWWMEDESFRLNLNSMGISPRGTGPGVVPGEVPLQGILSAFISSEEARETVASAFPGFRRRYPGGQIPESRALNHLSSRYPNLGEYLRFYTTPHSGGLNVSRHGFQRVNLNQIVSSSTNPLVIRQQLDSLLAPIRQALPGFGQRFYRLSTSAPVGGQVSESHAEIYLEKLAANLRDALSPDSQPTIVLADGSVLIGSEPTAAIQPVPVVLRPDSGALLTGKPGVATWSNNPAVAIGKKNVPYLQEYACRVTLKSFDIIGNTRAAYGFALDHYFEFWNMGTRDINVQRGDLGADPFLLIHDLPGFDVGALGSITHSEGHSIRIPLPKTLVFPAGQVTVLTTDPTPNSMLLRSTNHHVTLPTDRADFTYTGNTTYKTKSDEEGGVGKFRVNINPRHTARTDYGTKVLLGNEHGIIESQSALPLIRGDSPGNFAFSIHNDEKGSIVWDRIGGRMVEAYNVRGGSLRGNLTSPTITGDPRSNNEQLILRAYDASGDHEQSRYYSSEIGNPSSTGVLNIPARSTIGAHNWNFVSPLLWPDSFAPSADGVDSPMVIPNGSFQSIGELGHIYDPARVPGPTGVIGYSRGGGRTLTIGQPDPLYDGNTELAAWRLVDLFSTSDALLQPGLVNLNGLLRDGGAVLRTLLHGFTFITGSERDPALAGAALEKSTVDALVDALEERITSHGPLMERGELSECLNIPLSSTTPREHLYDRGREELFRRLIELITTRGNIFTVYAVGQTCEVTRDGSRAPLASSRLRITFELVPEWSPELPIHATAANASTRLRPPERFAARIISVSHQ